MSGSVVGINIVNKGGFQTLLKMRDKSVPQEC